MTKTSKRSPEVGAATTTAGAEPTLADWLTLSRPHLSKELVDDESFDRLLQMGRHLPGDVMAAIEVRLAPGRAPVDLSVRLMEPRQGLQVMPHLPASYDFLEQLFRDWADGVPSTQGIHSLWLEFDADRLTGDSLPEPVVCARLRGDVEATAVTEHLLPRLQASPLSRQQETLLQHSWHQFSAAVTPLYVFSLWARQVGVIRLEVYGENLEELLEWLSHIDHPASRYRDDCASVLQSADRFHVSLDMEPNGWAQQIGLEVSFRRQPPREPGWAKLFEGLAVAGLCEPQKKRALEAWIGKKGLATSKLVSALSHAKLISSGNGKAIAKAYLMLQMLPAETMRAPR